MQLRRGVQITSCAAPTRRWPSCWSRWPPWGRTQGRPTSPPHPTMPPSALLQPSRLLWQQTSLPKLLIPSKYQGRLPFLALPCPATPACMLHNTFVHGAAMTCGCASSLHSQEYPPQQTQSHLQLSLDNTCHSAYSLSGALAIMTD